MEDSFNDKDELKNIPLSNFSALSKIPKEYIKKELFIENEDISMKELRGKILNYLDKIDESFKEKSDVLVENKGKDLES